MNVGITDCNHQRIDDFLRSDQFGIEDQQLVAHLDNCVVCRQYMESQVGDPVSWSQAAQMLQPGTFDIAGTVEYSLATTGCQRSNQPIAIQSVLDSLLPSDDPNRLGRLGNYEVSGVIGAGGMGVVLKAIDPSLDRVVAIKVMAPHLANNATARKRFSREAKAAAAVLHPNVIPIHSVSGDDSNPYLVMAYVRGGSLQKRLDREGPLTTIEILRIGSQIAMGLAAAHEQGLVHRDIKPENILLEEGVERVTLTDFGLARAVDDASVTRDGTIAGTPQYMSPEQARGEYVDQKSDLFSLGSVLYALGTGRPPFRADSSYGVMQRINDESPVPIRDLNPEIPEWLCAVITRLMAKEKANRFKSANDVHQLLESCLSHAQQPMEKKLPEIPQLPRHKSKTPVLKILLGVFTMCTFLLTLFLVLEFPGFPQQEQQVNQNPAPVAVVQDATRSQAGESVYVPTPATKKLLDDVIRQIKSKKSPWGDSIVEKQNFWIGELQETIPELVHARLQAVQTGKLKDTKQSVNELRGLAQQLKTISRPNESSYAAARRIAEMTWPLLLNGYPDEFNEAMVELTVPYSAIRVNDKLGEAGRPTEPLGWGVQAAHALALARAGKITESLKVNEALMKKIDVNVHKGRLPDLPLQFLGETRSVKSLLQQALLQKSIILGIAGRTVESVDASTTAGRVEVDKPTQDDQPAIQVMLLALAKANAPDEASAPDEANSGASVPRTILDQGYTILDGGESIGSRRLVVTAKDQVLSIVDEYSLAIKWQGAPLGIVERDYSADYSLMGDTPLVLQGTSSTKGQGSLIMQGKVEFKDGVALAKWTNFSEFGRLLDIPQKQQSTEILKTSSGPLVLGHSLQVVGPLILTTSGDRTVVWANIDDKASGGKPFIDYEYGCKLRRTSRPAGAGFKISLFKPNSEKPDMTVEYDPQGRCESVHVGSTTVMKPNDQPKNADVQ